MADMLRSAVISDCGQYRYGLGRSWDVSKPLMIFVMLNPSTADKDVDDPTIRRCMEFARREGFGGIRVVNLFAWRATDPRVLLSILDPVGPENVVALDRALLFGKTGAQVVCAWGANPLAVEPAESFSRMARVHGVTLWCFGRTGSGAPRHPLYVKGCQPLEIYT